MKMNSLVSIITPSYNSSKFIEECVASVLLQSYTNWELLIVDDCSKDNSRDLLTNLAEKEDRIKLTFLDENIGAAKARNIAIRNAKGKYIAFLDSDDVWQKDKLEKQIKFMEGNDIAFSFTSYTPISEDGTISFSEIVAPTEIGYSSYLKNTIIGCLTVIIDKEKVGNFEMPIIKSSHDMALWLLIMKRGFTAYGMQESLAKYRIVSTSNTSNKFKTALDVWKVYREIEGLSLIYSAWCFVNYAVNAVKKRM